MISLEPSQFELVADIVGDTPFSVTPYFFLRRRACDVYGDAANQPRLDKVGGFLVPIDLVAPIRHQRKIDFDVEGLCFTFRRPPSDFAVWRPELVRRLTIADASHVDALPGDAAFLYQNYGSPADLLAEGLAFGVFRDERLVSMAASLVLTPKHCDVGVYTLRRYRSQGYATDCVESLFAHVLARGILPVWRIGVRQKVAIYFAERLEMDEIGVDGQEVYLQVHPAR